RLPGQRGGEGDGVGAAVHGGPVQRLAEAGAVGTAGAGVACAVVLVEEDGYEGRFGIELVRPDVRLGVARHAALVSREPGDCDAGVDGRASWLRDENRYPGERRQRAEE